MIKKGYYKKVWGSIGFIVNLSQMIEYNLANILALNDVLSAFDETESMYVFEYNELVEKTEEWYKKIDKLELGKLLNDDKKYKCYDKIRKILTEPFINYLNEIREDRNFFVHNFFKEDLMTKEFQNNPKQFITRLQDLVGRMNAANEELVSIFQDLQNEVKMIY